MEFIKWYCTKGTTCQVRRDLTGNVAVVTGGVNGIGWETVQELQKSGCTVIIGDMVKPTRDLPKGVIYYPLDLGSKKST